MNIDDLKKPIPALDYDDSPYLSGLNEGQAIGWNEAIDYLASRGYLATQQPADAVEALDIFDKFCNFIDGLHMGGFVENDFMSKREQRIVRSAITAQKHNRENISNCCIDDEGMR